MSVQTTFPADLIQRYGGGPDGAASSTAAIAVMAATLGYVIFPSGTYRIDRSIEINVPCYFDPGAKLLIDSGTVVAFSTNANIRAPRQQIFAGAGTVTFDTVIGLTWFPEWWGAFGDNAALCGTILQRTAAAFSASTENNGSFGAGVYKLDDNVQWPRGTRLFGEASTRRSVFAITKNAGNTFETLDVACCFENLQFETWAVDLAKTAGSIIFSDDADTIVRNCTFGSALNCVSLAGAGSQALDLSALGSGTATPLNNTSVLQIAGSGITARNIQGPQSVAGGTGGCIIDVVADAAAAGDFLIDGVRGIQQGGKVVRVRSIGTGGFIDGGQMFGVRSRDGADRVVELIATSTNQIRNVFISGIYGGNYSTQELLTIETTNAGATISNIVATGLSARAGLNAINLIETSGTIDDVQASASQVDTMTNKLVMSGTPTSVRLDPSMREDPVPKVVNVTIADDGVYDHNLVENAFALNFILSTNSSSAGRGIFAARCASSPFCAAIASTGGTITPTTGVLTGTTGVDGNITVSAAAGHLYIENRTGGSISVALTLFTQLFF